MTIVFVSAACGGDPDPKATAVTPDVYLLAMPGVTIDVLAKPFTDQGFALEEFPATTRVMWQLRQKNPNGVIKTIEIKGAARDPIEQTRSTFINFDKVNHDAERLSFFRQVTRSLYPGWDTRKMEQWLKEHQTGRAENFFDGI